MNTSNQKLHRPHTTKQSGFTLIELLVVVSIIALLSTIVLAVVQDGRVKARNTAKNNLVMEYIKALELYRTDTGIYPSHPGTPQTEKCVGYPETPLNNSDNCFGNSFDGSNTINSAISTYIKGDFAHTVPVMFGSNDLNGIWYQCNNPTCDSYQLTWMLEKQINNCILNATKVSPHLNNTRCVYPQ